MCDPAKLALWPRIPNTGPTTGSHQLQPHDLLSHLFNRSSFRKRASLASSPPPPPRSASFSETTIRSDLLPEYFPTRDSGPAGNYCRISHLPLADIFIRLAITKKPSLPSLLSLFHPPLLTLPIIKLGTPAPAPRPVI